MISNNWGFALVLAIIGVTMVIVSLFNVNQAIGGWLFGAGALLMIFAFVLVEGENTGAK